MKTFYDLLNIPQEATFQETKQAYFDTLRIVHPDKGATDFEAFGQIQKAYETLRYKLYPKLSSFKYLEIPRKERSTICG